MVAGNIFLLILLVFLSAFICCLPLESSELESNPEIVALKAFKSAVTNDPLGVLSDWVDSIHHCDWTGVSCDSAGSNVVSITLFQKELRGAISPFLGNFSSLHILDLSLNIFTGFIPAQLGLCSELAEFRLAGNSLSGAIPSELGKLKNLQILDLGSNFLNGTIPESVSNCSALSTINFNSNDLTGTIPQHIGNLISLETFEASANDLFGSIPTSIGRLHRLKTLDLSQNQLSGTLPSEIGSLSSLLTLELFENKLTGSIPSSLSLCKSLVQLELSNNNLTGKIPLELGSMELLERLTLDQNNLSGGIPSSLMNLTSLRYLALSDNPLGGRIPKNLGSLYNLEELILQSSGLVGTIPSTIYNCSSLQNVTLTHNAITGTLPSAPGKLKNLIYLSIGDNRMEGEIPDKVCQCTQLHTLDLAENNFSGSVKARTIPSGLRFLDLSHNRLTGSIPRFNPSSYWGFYHLNLSNNFFTGSMPADLGAMELANAIDLSNNNLTGSLPVTLEICTGLLFLNLSQNNLSGGLSVNFTKLNYLASLDLSGNEFDGSIPRSLADVPSLKHLNLSHNRLEGPVPNSGFFLKMSSSTLEGNPRLCGLKFLSPCKDENHNSHRFSKKALLIVLIVSSVCLLLLLIIASVVVSRCIRKRKTEDIEEKITGYPDLKRFTSREIEIATDCFDERNVIGRSAISIVYRGTLPDGRVVAVKKLSLNQFSAVSDRCFNTELNILTRLRHRNLVKIEGYAWESGKLKALVLEFMKNGSLESIIHDPSRDETRWMLSERLKVLISAANGLVYLHSEYDFPILHCDLKPSNILLDEDFEAHVSDFGTARILGIHLQDGSSLSSSPSVFQGTIGYLAPELAYMGRSSTKADVFSFGVVIMELLTGKRPTGGLEDDGVSITLREYVQKALATGNGSDALLKLVDPHLASSVRNDIERENMVKLLKLAISCTAHYPNDRPGIEGVLSSLLKIKCQC